MHDRRAARGGNGLLNHLGAFVENLRPRQWTKNLLLFAGIWDVWYKDDYAVKTFSIITAPPNKEVAPLHNRMPMVLPRKEQQQRWLQDLDIAQVMELLQPPPDGILDYYQVSDKVNSVKNDSPELHQRIGGQPTLF